MASDHGRRVRQDGAHLEPVVRALRRLVRGFNLQRLDHQTFAVALHGLVQKRLNFLGRRRVHGLGKRDFALHFAKMLPQELATKLERLTQQGLCQPRTSAKRRRPRLARADVCSRPLSLEPLRPTYTPIDAQQIKREEAHLHFDLTSIDFLHPPRRPGPLRRQRPARERHESPWPHPSPGSTRPCACGCLGLERAECASRHGPKPRPRNPG